MENLLSTPVLPCITSIMYSFSVKRLMSQTLHSSDILTNSCNVCMRERRRGGGGGRAERERDGGREGEGELGDRGRERERENVCV